MSIKMWRCHQFTIHEYDFIHSVLIKDNDRIFTVFTKFIDNEFKYHILERITIRDKIKSISLTEGSLIVDDFVDYLMQIKSIIENIVWENGVKKEESNELPAGVGKCNSCGKVREGNYFYALKGKGYTFICDNCQDKGDF